MRTSQELKNDWYFSKTCTSVPVSLPVSGDWEKVCLPHTWNAVDGQIGIPFDRGAYWYVTTFEAPSQPLDAGRIYIEVGACSLRGEIWLNGEKVAEHVGGYSAFRADVSERCQKGTNVLAILADNSYSDKVYPQRADFTFYGGLYRYVRVISAPKDGFTLDDLGGSGVYIDATPKDGAGLVHVKAKLSSFEPGQTVSLEIFDADGRTVTESWAFAAEETELNACIPSCRVWDGVKDPYLYKARIRLVSFNEVVDEVTESFGVMEFEVSPKKGFILNGREMPIRGVCRHQDRMYVGNALSHEEEEEDMRLIAEMGANGVRLAHYQQSREIYDLCDRLGLVVWAEIPYFAQSWDDDAHASAVQEIRELVIQNYNHPSICFWGLSNEVLMMGNDNPKLLPCHEDLNRAVKSIDQKRMTVIAHEYFAEWSHKLHDVSDAEGWNHYFGWYRGAMEDLGKWADEYHAAHPDRRIAISEYGCDSVVRYHSDNPVKMDYSEEYQVLIHESACEDFATRPWIWGTFVWNMYDFGSYFRREGGTKGRNNKGLVTFDRKIKKDAYYVYKAWFSEDPFVHMDGRRYFQRPGDRTVIRIHSNQPKVSLYVDGTLFGTQEGSHVFVFENVPLSPAGTFLEAKAGSCTDTMTLRGGLEDPDAFVFPGFKEAQDAKNWFEGVDDIAGAMETKEGFYSIHDPVSEIMASAKAKKVIMDTVIAVSERSLPESLIFDGDLSLPVSEFMITGFRESLISKKRDLALRRIHTALSQIPKEG